jgi:acyl-CoA synthetase (AMP-forming)/AMP-acid ligase II
MRIIDLFDRGVSLGADRVCLRSDTRVLTYGDVQARTYRIGRALLAAGVGKDSVSAVLSPNDIDAFAAVFGILRAGATWMPLNARNTLQENIANLRRFRGHWLFYHSTFADDVRSIFRSLPTLRGAVCVDRDDGPYPGLVAWCESSDASAFDVASDFDDVSWLFLTGGTTGQPKGIMLTHRNLETMVANTVTAMPYDRPPRYLMAAPMTHAAGCFGMSLLGFGPEFIFLPRADPALIPEAIEGESITTLFLPPTVIYMLMARTDIRKFNYSSLKHLIYGAAPISMDKLRAAIDVFGPVLCEIYGQSESPAPCTFLSPEEHHAILQSGDPDRLMSCGRPTMFTELAILDDDANPVVPGRTGEIGIRGQHVMKGYFDDEMATAAVSRNGWHLTGDVGYRDGEGYVFIIDRKKEMIISGGFNIFPREIEQTILEHRDVQDCAVVGVPDEKWGETVLAVLEPKDGAELDLSEIAAFCRHRLGGVKAPKAYEVVKELPRSGAGKILRRSIRDRYWEGRDRKL